jgi:hypothetical protein
VSSPLPSCGNSHREIKSSRLQAHPCISKQTQAASPGLHYSIPSIAQHLQQEQCKNVAADDIIKAFDRSSTGVRWTLTDNPVTQTGDVDKIKKNIARIISLSVETQ